ncbi:thermostable direct hemolysin-family toxin [Vibrio sp. NTOU-M3]|uniref:thermostable direct hemolysin-family toxin n=1 Tax=Vibrio sp. NTOU-M3 TaxID=3234954 RepID=UPI00349F867F
MKDKQKTLFPLAMLLISSNVLARGIPELPPIPIPASGEVVYTVKNLSNAPVELTSFTSETTNRIPTTPVLTDHQSVFTASGSPWMASVITLNIESNKYSVSTMKGYKDFSELTYINTAPNSIDFDFDAIHEHAVYSNTIPYKTDHEISNKYVHVESYIAGSGYNVNICVANIDEKEKCLNQN